MTTIAEDNYPGLGAASYALALLFIAYIFSFIDRQILSLLVGPIREDFGITDFEFSLLQGAAFAVIYTFAGLPLGRLADRYSRRLIISGSVLFWSLMTVACGMTRNFGQLFVARMGVGVGEAGLSPAAYSLILDSFRPQHATYAMSFYKLGVKIGAGLALVIGGVLYDFYASIGTVTIPILGPVVPWQATIITVGAPGVLHGARTYVMQDEWGQTVPSQSISAGLDYPGVGPEHAWLHDAGRATYEPVTDAEAMEAFSIVSRTEGILPAIETAHALAGAMRLGRELGPDAVIVINLSGRGDKDVETAARWFGIDTT